MFGAWSGRLIAGLSDGSLQSWLCPEYKPLRPPYSPFVDARARLSKAQKDVSEIESNISSFDPSVCEAKTRAVAIRQEITRHLEQSTFDFISN